MITRADIAHWRTRVPWVSAEHVEQDLVLSRLIVEIARHPLLGQELIFRGGTCLHKLWLDRPWRYSEDLDYVRRSDGGIGDVLDAIRDIAGIVGFDTYRPESWTPSRAAANLNRKLDSTEFATDLTALVADWPAEYSVDAGRDVAHSILDAIEAHSRS